MLTRQAIILAVIRTAVPGAIGALLAQLIARVPVVADIIATIDSTIASAVPELPGLTVRTILNAASVGAIIGAYYWLARLAGRRWPSIERWLLGSAQQPVAYAKQNSDGAFVITAVPEAPVIGTRRTVQIETADGRIGYLVAGLPNPSTSSRAAYQAAIDAHNPTNFDTPGGHNQP